VYGYDKQTAKDRSQQIIEKFDLGEVAERRAKTLSGGWQRRLSVAIALVSNPKIIFLDEPTLGMDVLARRELWKIIQSLKGKVTIILTSHYLEEIVHLCDKVAILANGNVMAVGTVDEIKAQTGKDNFEDAFVKIVDTNLDEA
jgi:ABC-2 type transport system ATP-binding protein